MNKSPKFSPEVRERADCVKKAAVNSGQRVGITSLDAQRIKELEREVKELRRANDIRKTASAFFAQAELDRMRSINPALCTTCTS